MTSRQAVFGAAFCALFSFDLAGAAPSGAGAISDMKDHPGDWKLDFKNTDSRQTHSIQFVRLLDARDAHGMVKYDVILMTSDPRYPFGLWDTYLGKCDSHATADIWMGEIDSEGDAKGAPSVRTDFEPEIKHTPRYETLEKICASATMENVQDPIAAAREFLKR
jgi:hypothetical protein